MGSHPAQGALTQEPGLLTRLFVIGLLVAIAACAVADANAWPLTGWKLFSQVRTGRAMGWDVQRVDRKGVEHAAALASLGRGYRGTLHVLNAFPQLAPSERAAVCDAWLHALRARGDEAVALRIYRTAAVGHLGDHRPPRPHRVRLRWECRHEVFQ